MFDWIEIWRIGWPISYKYVLLSELVLYFVGSMDRSVVVHKLEVIGVVASYLGIKNLNIVISEVSVLLGLKITVYYI